MQFMSAIISAFALCMASHALGAAIDSPVQDIEAADPLIATDPFYACNCPNNCSHKAGSGCKYHSGPSDKSSVVKGKCVVRGGGLTCVSG
ncbi:hypothetical protein SMACR_09189 [Sordaria macrospora]|uniref:WGS project CABT00000000 data, contig 2.75 n=2 Tax=Sordaria macrospora TaxID=5147 RepID=F7WBG7_SORMK|nr:uncharacterized protein SMAC_09189 [Sordaria macrospora k-hell]KAA8635156.1 hypothetical protein SMACR_09189 [Sordaria macrospora]WPJ67033.1 hypothetical protein SMAC4_09189 [Sordaria macrospora]CCC05439.1 unnamed protein product [Sordaria macrospora k-hell]